MIIPTWITDIIVILTMIGFFTVVFAVAKLWHDIIINWKNK